MEFTHNGQVIRTKSTPLLTMPQCPECGKLGVEMVETASKYICPRCNYKVIKSEV